MTASFKDMLHWITERESIRIKKEAGKTRPWTKDHILHDWRFCNVRREDDTVTKWINQNVREAYADHPLLWLMLCLSRQINLPSTLEALIEQYPSAWPGSKVFNPIDLRDALEDRASMGLKNYTGVYVISAPPSGGSKPQYTALDVIGKLYMDRDVLQPLFTGSRAESMQNAHAALMRYPGWGPFLSYQAVVDMRFTKIFDYALDRETWCAAGPGTLRGLNRIYDRPTDFGLNKLGSPSVQLMAKSQIVALWPRLIAETGVQMDLSDVPNVLCETDKYLRVKNGEGVPRNKYQPAKQSSMEQDLF